MTSKWKPRYDRNAFSDRAQQALATSKKLLEVHEGGPMGPYRAHTAMREVGIIRCPICPPESSGGSGDA